MTCKECLAVHPGREEGLAFNAHLHRDTCSQSAAYQERRRYAVLAAAAVIYAAGQHVKPGADYMTNWQNYETAVYEAGQLLAEIEKLERP